LISPKFLFAGLALAAVLTAGVACSDDDGNSDLLPDQTPSIPTILPSPPAANGIEDDKEEFKDDVNNQIDQLEARIDELKQDASNGEAKDDAQKRIDDLKGDVDDLKDKLARVDTANGDDLDRLKQDIDNKLDETRTKVESLADELGL
jgi:hypothetical protein